MTGFRAKLRIAAHQFCTPLRKWWLGGGGNAVDTVLAFRFGMGCQNLGYMDGKDWWHPPAFHAGAGTTIWKHKCHPCHSPSGRVGLSKSAVMSICPAIHAKMKNCQAIALAVIFALFYSNATL